MSAYPLMLEGSEVAALVVGGGAVATRKVRALLDAGARVHVIAREVSGELRALGTSADRLEVTQCAYSRNQLSASYTLVIAATNDETLNAAVAADARAMGRLVNVVGEPALGNCVTPAIHRAGDVVIGVTAGGVPAVASRIRDAIAREIDARYASAASRLAGLRRALIDAGQRDRWSAAAAVLAGPEFCDDVESGRFDARIAEWG